MTHAFDISLSSWALGLDSPVLRKPFRRPALRHADFEDRYDFQSVFYDCFRSADGASLLLVGPPLQNLAEDLGLRFFAMPGGEELVATALPRVFASLLRIAAPPGLQCLRIESVAGTAFIVPQPNLASLFAGKRVLVTLSQNNELEWIRDWIAYHQRLHGCDAALVYDNNSTRYDVSELRGCLAAMPGITGAALSWPFRYGPFDGRLPLTYDLWEGHFCQFAMLEHARFRFLADARCALNLDIDELVVCPDGASICDLTEASHTGVMQFGGKWVEPFASRPFAQGATPLHRYFHHRKAGQTQDCENKYAFVPGRLADDAQLAIHEVYGRLSSALPAGVGLRHFKALNTNWTVDRPGTLAARTGTSARVEDLAEDTELAALLDAAFATAPDAPIAGQPRDAETAYYQSRLKSGQLLRSGQLSAAEAHIRDALARSPQWPSGQLFHADLLDRAGDGTAAERIRAGARALQDSDAAASHERARYLLHTGDWQGAVRGFRKAIRIDRGFAPAYIALARALWVAGHRRGAELLIRRGLGHSPASGLLQGALAEMLQSSGQPNEALQLAEAGLQSQPHNPRLLLLRSRLLRDLGRPEEALVAAAQVVHRQSDGALLIADLEAAIDHPFDVDYPDTEPLTASIEYLSALLQAGRLEEADAFSHRLLLTEADRPQALEARHKVLAALGRTDEAKAVLAQAVDWARREYECQPPQTLGRYRECTWRDGRIRRLHGLLRSAGREAEAAALLDTELQHNPASGLIALKVSDLLSGRQPVANARELVETALRQMPRDARLWREYGRILERDGDLDGAIAAYRNALRNGPAAAWLLSHLANLITKGGSDDPQAIAEAERLLREALASDGAHALSHSRLGDLLWRTGRREEALAAWRTALELAPGEAWLWSHFGDRLTEAGSLREAEDALQQALALRPDDPLTLYRLARLRERTDKLEESIALMSRAVALAPDKDWLSRYYEKLLARSPPRPEQG